MKERVISIHKFEIQVFGMLKVELILRLRKLCCKLLGLLIVLTKPTLSEPLVVQLLQMLLCQHNSFPYMLKMLTIKLLTSWLQEIQFELQVILFGAI